MSETLLTGLDFSYTEPNTPQRTLIKHHLNSAHGHEREKKYFVFVCFVMEAKTASVLFWRTLCLPVTVVAWKRLLALVYFLNPATAMGQLV